MLFGMKMPSKTNTRVLLLLLGILFASLFIHGTLIRIESFEGQSQSALNSALEELDETKKQEIVNELKNNATNIVQRNLDYLLPCLLKMDSCKNGLAMTPIQPPSTVENTVMPSNKEDNEPVPNVPPITIEKPIVQNSPAVTLPNGNITIDNTATSNNPVLL